MAPLIRLTWPVLVAQLAMMGNGVLDTIMTARFSSEALAAVGIGLPLFAAVFITASGVLLALTLMAAHLYGAGRHADVGEEVRQASWLALALLVIVEALLLHPGPLLAIAKLNAHMEPKVREYLAALAWYAPAGMVIRLFQATSSAIGKPRAAMMLSLLMLALKAPFNWLFIYGHLGLPPLGAAGCGIAGACAGWITAMVAWRWLAKGGDYQPYAIFARWSWPSWRALRPMLQLGLPIGATFFLEVAAISLVALFVARLGPVASGAHQITANLSLLCFMLPTAIGQAGAILIGQSLGAGQTDQARQTGLRGLALGLGCTALLAALVSFNSTDLAALYTSDPEVQTLAAGLVRQLAPYLLGASLHGVAVNLLRGHKRATVPMTIHAAALWGVGLLGGVWLGLDQGQGPAGFWIAATAAVILAGLAVTVYWWRIATTEVAHNAPVPARITP